MPAKPFTIVFPDRSKKHVSASKKEQMLLAGEIERLDDRTYKFLGRIVVLSSFQELVNVLPRIESSQLRRFYPGTFIWEFEDEHVRELVESPEGMALRLRSPRGKFCPYRTPPSGGKDRVA